MILCLFPIALFGLVFLSLCLLGLLSDSSQGSVIGTALDLTLSVIPWMFLVAFIWIVFSYCMGGDVILSIARARKVTFDENRDLYRLVGNTAIMAGLPMPELYLIDDESMNAFATGRNPEAASIALTHGIVKNLEKAELQAVIAHELAHIGNRDTRLMTITIAGIGCFTFFGELLFRSALRASARGSRGKKSGKGGNGALIILAVGIICLVFGYLVAPILHFALSRRREYQADATAVKICRDPEALARALTKIAVDPRVEVLDANPLVGNMCIASPAKNCPMSILNLENKLYSTHPKIEDRITALEKMMGKDK